MPHNKKPARGEPKGYAGRPMHGKEWS